MLYSNSVHLNWTLLEYYYPNNAHAHKQEVLDVLENNDEEIWLFWNQELTENERVKIEEQTYSVEKIHEGAFANGEYYYAYQFHRIS